jgi:hypothetical protein
MTRIEKIATFTALAIVGFVFAHIATQNVAAYVFGF